MCMVSRREALDWNHPMSGIGIVEVLMDCVQALLVLTVMFTLKFTLCLAA